jgi:hypothetical protein
MGTRRQERLLREAIREVIASTGGTRLIEQSLGVNLLTPAPLRLLTGPSPRAGRMSDMQLLEVYFSRRRGLLTESHMRRVSRITEGVMDGLNAFSKFIGKGIDVAKGVADALQNNEILTAAAKKAGETLDAVKSGAKAMVASIGDFFTNLIRQLPGGEVVLRFMSNYAGRLQELISQAGASVRDTLGAWKQKAQDYVVEWLVQHLFDKDKSLKGKVMKHLGISEKKMESARSINRRRGIRTLQELDDDFERENRTRMAERSRPRRLREEQPPAAEISDKGAQAVTIEDILKVQESGTQTARLMGFLEGDASAGPSELLRGNLALIVKKILTAVVQIAAKDPSVYTQHVAPLWQSRLFAPFKTGWGLAMSAVMGIAASASIALDAMVKFLGSMMKGFDLGGGDATKETQLAGQSGVKVTLTAEMFMSEGAKLMIDLVAGIIEGSNLEIIIRLMTGDATKVGEAVKRISGTIVNAIKAAVLKLGPAAVQTATGGKVADQADGGVAFTIGNALADMFPA